MEPKAWETNYYKGGNNEISINPLNMQKVGITNYSKPGIAGGFPNTLPKPTFQNEDFHPPNEVFQNPGNQFQNISPGQKKQNNYGIIPNQNNFYQPGNMQNDMYNVEQMNGLPLQDQTKKQLTGYNDPNIVNWNTGYQNQEGQYGVHQGYANQAKDFNLQYNQQNISGNQPFMPQKIQNKMYNGPNQQNNEQIPHESSTNKTLISKLLDQQSSNPLDPSKTANSLPNKFSYPNNPPINPPVQKNIQNPIPNPKIANYYPVPPLHNSENTSTIQSHIKYISELPPFDIKQLQFDLYNIKNNLEEYPKREHFEKEIDNVDPNPTSKIHYFYNNP